MLAFISLIAATALDLLVVVKSPRKPILELTSLIAETLFVLLVVVSEVKSPIFDVFPEIPATFSLIAPTRFDFSVVVSDVKSPILDVFPETPVTFSLIAETTFDLLVVVKFDKSPILLSTSVIDVDKSIEEYKDAINKLENIGTNIKIYTHMQVREDDISLYGFNTNEELRMFELLISVN